MSWPASARGWSRDRREWDREAARARPRHRTRPIVTPLAPAPPGSSRVPSLVGARVFFWRRLRVGLRGLLGFFRRIVGLFRCSRGPFVVGRVEPRALEMHAGAARDQPLRALTAHGALRVALTRDAGERFFKQVPVRALVFVGRHREVSPASTYARTAAPRTDTASLVRRRRRPAAAQAAPTVCA